MGTRPNRCSRFVVKSRSEKSRISQQLRKKYQNLEIIENFEISKKNEFSKTNLHSDWFCLELASGDPTYLLPQLIPGGAASDSVAPPPTKRIPLCRFPRNGPEVRAKIQCMVWNFCRESRDNSAAKSRVPMTTNPHIRSGTRVGVQGSGGVGV